MYLVHGNPNLTSFVTDMLIYYVPMATEEKAKLSQTYNLPRDEVQRAVPRGSRRISRKRKKLEKGQSTARF